MFTVRNPYTTFNSWITPLLSYTLTHLWHLLAPCLLPPPQIIATNGHPVPAECSSGAISHRTAVSQLQPEPGTRPGADFKHGSDVDAAACTCADDQSFNPGVTSASKTGGTDYVHAVLADWSSIVSKSCAYFPKKSQNFGWINLTFGDMEIISIYFSTPNPSLIKSLPPNMTLKKCSTINNFGLHRDPLRLS